MAVKFEVLEREKIMMEAANSESVGGFGICNGRTNS